MIKTTRHFFIFSSGLIVCLVLALGVVTFMGDAGGEPLNAKFTFYPEGTNGYPQLALTFEEGAKLPESSAIESAFEVRPPLSGDFGWKGATLLFSPSTRLASNTEYQVRLRGGLKLAGGGRLDYAPTVWSFHTRNARLAYLKRVGQSVNLWLDERDGSAPHQLTFETDRKVLDFSVSPGGERIVYSLEESNFQEAGLWLLQLPRPAGATGQEEVVAKVKPTSSFSAAAAASPSKLVFESKVRTTAPRWSPAGDLIAYERRVVFTGGAFGPAQLWLIKADGTSLPPLYGGNQQVGVDLAWAAGGDRAFFWEPRQEAIGDFNFTGEPRWKTLKGLKIEGLTPSPDGRELIITYYDYSGPKEKEVLLRLNSVKGKTPEESWAPSALQPPAVEGYSARAPAWSPDGRWLVYLRQAIGIRSQTAGKLWLFDTQTGYSRPVVESDEAYSGVSHGNFDWSPDGQTILFERYSLGTGIRPTVEGTELWQTSMNGKELKKLASGVFNPKWVF